MICADQLRRRVTATQITQFTVLLDNVKLKTRVRCVTRQSTRGEERPRAPLMEDVQSGIQQYLNVAGAASRLTALTICKSLCHLSTFQKAGLKADSHTLPTPSSSPSFTASSGSLSLMTKPLGGPSDRTDPHAPSDVNSLMVTVALLL